MPTNLKSLLSRSRSRNDLKSKDKGEESCCEAGNNEGNGRVASAHHQPDQESCSCAAANEGTLSGSTPCQSHSCGRTSGFPHEVKASGESTRAFLNPPGRENDTRCNNLFLSCNTLNHTFSPSGSDTPETTSTSTCGLQKVTNYQETTSPFSPHSPLPQLPQSTGSSHLMTESGSETRLVSGKGLTTTMRKCETMLTLSSYATGNGSGAGTHTSAGSKHSSSTSPFSSISSSGTSTGKVRVMKDKIFSTSSSTLNCLLHSSSRSKLFSTWKLGPSSSHQQNITSSTKQQQAYQPEFLDVQRSGGGSGSVRGTSDYGCGPASADVLQISKSQLSIPESGVTAGTGTAPVTPLNRLRRNISINNPYFSLGANSSYSRSSSVASFCWKEDSFPEILCRLCLTSVWMEDTVEIGACACRYCRDCLTAYVTFEINEGAEDIACPDAKCETLGAISFFEVESLVPTLLVEKYKKFRLYREVEKDGDLMWCPSPGCETICQIKETTNLFVDGRPKSRGSINQKSLIINCATCSQSFCAECKLSSHQGTSCESFRRKLIKQGKLTFDDEELFALESIKKCPFCHVPIEKDSGCAQMMCKRCKHVFCWYCLASLDDDFLLRHYDKGPCKNKLGHSRASVVWHRAQVIGIFAGFGILVLLASPLLILAAPCLLCCRCRYCANKLETEEPPAPV